AEISGTSLRALQEGFRRFKGTTPMGYLRGVRLARVRAELTGPGMADRSVTEIALRWGFTHLGRFAESYRAAYGETPSATLRQNA
ncbi:MAG: helix-turn-helix transcriptional regulator, partial [Ferrovibrionaceae bacterium]